MCVQGLCTYECSACGGQKRGHLVPCHWNASCGCWMLSSVEATADFPVEMPFQLPMSCNSVGLDAWVKC